MRGMCMYVISTEADLSFQKELDIDNFISELILSNNLLYNLCSFV